MRGAVIGGLVGAALAIAAVACWQQVPQASAQRVQYTGEQEGQLIALPVDMDERRQMITVIDPQQKTLAVYHVEKASGKVSLRSVRNIRWDLHMEEFNGNSPSPQEIRSLLGRR